MDTLPINADVISRDEGRRLLDESAVRWLGMTREEFIQAWDAGRFSSDDRLAVQQVAMLLPFGR